MKSLDLVKETIEEVEEHIESLKSFDAYYDDEQESLTKLELIKQDLEVLEILKKNTRIQTYEFLSIKSIFMYLIFDSVEEDYEKIKQWLEGYK